MDLQLLVGPHTDNDIAKPNLESRTSANSRREPRIDARSVVPSCSYSPIEFIPLTTESLLENMYHPVVTGGEPREGPTHSTIQ